jgi:subtilisin family serine protease
VAVLLLVGITAGPLAAAEAPRLQIAPQAMQQIRLALEQKARLTAVERRIDSALLIAQWRRRGALPANLAILRPGVDLRTDVEGRVLVDVEAQVSEPLLDGIGRLGGEVVSSHPGFDAVRAWIPITAVGMLAGLPAVRFVRPAQEPVAPVRAGATAAADDLAGDVAHRADRARQVFGVDGTGLSIGVLSDGVDSLASLQQAGILPEVTVLPGQAGSGSEGTAMMEIVHRLAPGARLFFATGFAGEASFAANILALREAGCDILVDDISYRTSPAFQDGIVARTVRRVIRQGTLYFSSAGNVGNLTHRSSGVWEGDFSAASDPLPGVHGIVHHFGTSVSDAVGGGTTATLQWSDPWGASTNDYDLCVLSPDLSRVFACSTNVQDGDDNPYEQIQTFDKGEQLVIVKAASAAPRFLRLNTHLYGFLEIATSGQVYGHPAVETAFAVAAVDVRTAEGGPFTGGAANPVESYSSDGRRRLFYRPDGAPITPGNFLASGGESILKPDIAAADQVHTETPGFGEFGGTSAAAPHAAAIAALVLQKSPGLTPAQVREVFTTTALDIEAPGPDRDSGAGIVNALAAVRKAFSLAPLPSCAAAATTLGLADGRFRLAVAWRIVERGLAGCGQPLPISDRAGTFWFFDPGLPELLVKIVNGCPVNGRHWIFAAGATDVQYELSVEDSVGGQTEVFRHPGGSPPASIADTESFALCP